jgi:hypothetical protein
MTAIATICSSRWRFFGLKRKPRITLGLAKKLDSLPRPFSAVHRRRQSVSLDAAVIKKHDFFVKVIEM